LQLGAQASIAPFLTSTKSPSMHLNSQGPTNASRSFQIKRPTSSTSISPTTTLPSRAARVKNAPSFMSTSPQILRATAGAKSPLLPFSPATDSAASATSSRSTQRAASLDTSLSPPSTPCFESISTSSSSNRDGVALRAHALRLENLASDAQQRLHAETQALQQVRFVCEFQSFWLAPFNIPLFYRQMLMQTSCVCC
jgi:hypothetical protein